MKTIVGIILLSTILNYGCSPKFYAVRGNDSITVQNSAGDTVLHTNKIAVNTKQFKPGTYIVTVSRSDTLKVY